jgi:predicted NBD/HSP70 family sugar kinase
VNLRPSQTQEPAQGDSAPQVRGSNHEGMRQFNERTVLQAIRLHGPTPKADLARLTQLSKQTVSIIVDRLLDDGLLVKLDRVRGGIGQPSVPLALNPDGAFSIGVQVGRRSLEIVVVDFVGAVRGHQTLRYDHPDPAQLLPHIERALQVLRDDLRAQWPRIVGLGLAAPLSMHQWADLMGPQAAQALARWEHVDLRAEVQKMTELPVVFARDTVAACTAELLQGHGQRWTSFLYVFIGTFVGGGLVLSGHLMPGPRGNAGAIGSMPLGLDGGSGSPQLLEVASGWPLERRLIAAGLDAQLAHSDAIVAPAYQTLVQPWLDEAGNALALTATTATALLDLDAVVLDGSLAPPLLDALVERARGALGRYRQAGIRPPRLERGSVGARARALGGALLPLLTQFFPDKDVFLKQDIG